MKFKEINPSPRTLMTPGPVEADPRVLRAMGAHILGQFDPEFTALMNETMEMERYVFQTQNKMTYLVDTTSRGGLETVLTGAICPGDKVLIPAFGRFGYLLAEILERCGADITLLEREWGTVFEPEEIEEALKKDSYKAVAFIHGETSTSMMQPLKEIGEICEKYGALLIVDAVATLGGAEVHVDDWKLSACISGTQKCISAPSGSALITYNEQIEEIVKKRKKVEKGIRTADDVNGSLAGMSQLSDEEKTQELMSVHEKVKELTGVEMQLFRPPYGDYDDAVVLNARENGYYPIQWDVDSLDWKDYGVDSILNTVLNHKALGNGSIILCHNGAKYTADALDALLDGLKEKGYQVVPISQLIYKENYHMDVTGRQIPDAK